MFDLIAFDADDTLWHNESLYRAVEQRYVSLLAPYADSNTVTDRLFQQEMRNLALYGYGIKSFTLSMIETAITLTDGGIRGAEIAQIIGFAKEMLSSNVRLLDNAETTVRALARTYPLMVITKGDLLDQTNKLARSGLRAHFRHFEVVGHKDPAAYAAILTRYGITPERFLMVGNSLKSDVLPVIALGGNAVYVPHQITWAHEVISAHEDQPDGYHEIAHLGELPDLIQALR